MMARAAMDWDAATDDTLQLMKELGFVRGRQWNGARGILRDRHGNTWSYGPGMLFGFCENINQMVAVAKWMTGSCRNCVDCIGGRGCVGCRDCMDCVDCRYCVGCRGCVGCVGCIGVRDCRYCMDCWDGGGCMDCVGCRDCMFCYSCVGCVGCRDCIDVRDGRRDVRGLWLRKAS